MANFIRIKENEYLNLDRVVTYSLEWVSNDSNKKCFLRFLTECKGLRWVETDKMELAQAENLMKEIQGDKGKAK